MKNIIFVTTIFVTLFFTFSSFAKPGAYKKFSGGWSTNSAMTSLGENLWVVNDGTLYKVDKNGKSVKATGRWSNVSGMTAIGEDLFILSNGIIYKVETK